MADKACQHPVLALTLGVFLCSSGRGVITWLSDGLGKVVPHPHEVLLSQDGKTSDAANQVKGVDLVAAFQLVRGILVI